MPCEDTLLKTHFASTLSWNHGGLLHTTLPDQIERVFVYCARTIAYWKYSLFQTNLCILLEMVMHDKSNRSADFNIFQTTPSSLLLLPRESPSVHLEMD